MVVQDTRKRFFFILVDVDTPTWWFFVVLMIVGKWGPNGFHVIEWMRNPVGSRWLGTKG